MDSVRKRGEDDGSIPANVREAINFYQTEGMLHGRSSIRAIAAELKMPKAFLEMLLLAAPLHDIGKIGIPDSVLLKPGPLSDEEWVIMQRHCEIG